MNPQIRYEVMMSHVSRASRMIGCIVLVQLVGGILTNFFLTASLFGSPGFMVNGAIYSQQIGLAVLIGLAMSGLSIALAITFFPILREYNLTLALCTRAGMLATFAMLQGENAESFLDQQEVKCWGER